MTDRPLLFSAPMVRALLEGRKTQTRRAMKPQPEKDGLGAYHVRSGGGGMIGVPENKVCQIAVDYVPYEAGDHIWVRETWRASYDYDHLKPADIPRAQIIDYIASDDCELNGKKRPAIFMPRWASRLTLVVTDVRVERLQDISDDDAVAEGLWYCEDGEAAGFWFDGPEMQNAYGDGAVECYAALWDKLNGPGSWKANPWVVALTFTVHHCNIDNMAATPEPRSAGITVIEVER